MRTVVGIASGLLSLKQYPHGTTVIGGGWQGVGNREAGGVALLPERLIGNVRLACHAIPALKEARLARAWAGLEAETADALPAVGPIPGHPDAYVSAAASIPATPAASTSRSCWRTASSSASPRCRFPHRQASAATGEGGMTRFDPQRLAGMHAATIVPMTADFRIDEAALAAHIAEVAGTPGIHGLLVNGHAGENFVLTSEEKRRVVAIAREVAPKSCVICSGINAESSLVLAEDARLAEAAGADLLLVFPPNSFALSHPETALIHQRHVLEATSLPLLLYGAPVGAGAMAYDAATLASLASEPRVLGIKDGSWEVAAYEANRRQLLALRPDFVVMGSGDEHLLTSYLIGSAGSQVSLAAIAPRLCADFYAAASRPTGRRPAACMT